MSIHTPLLPSKAKCLLSSLDDMSLIFESWLPQMVFWPLLMYVCMCTHTTQWMNAWVTSAGCKWVALNLGSLFCMSQCPLMPVPCCIAYYSFVQYFIVSLWFFFFSSQDCLSYLGSFVNSTSFCIVFHIRKGCRWCFDKGRTESVGHFGSRKMWSMFIWVC